MISETAKIAHGEMRAAGLEPTFDDIIRLNALGLRVDRSETSNDFSTLPRIAFLGDYILREPTIAVRVWMDEASRILEDTYFTRLSVTAFAMQSDPAELPSLNDARAIHDRVVRFRDEVLSMFTETEIFAAVDYALRGGSSEDDEYPELSEKDREKLNGGGDTPLALRSRARALLASAAGVGIDYRLALEATERHLETMIVRALCLKGAEAAKSIHMDNCGEFYRTVDRMRERLVNEKKTNVDKEVDNGKAEH